MYTWHSSESAWMSENEKETVNLSVRWWDTLAVIEVLRNQLSYIIIYTYVTFIKWMIIIKEISDVLLIWFLQWAFDLLIIPFPF